MSNAQYIRLRHGVKTYRLKVEKIYHSDQVIRYRISGNNRSVVMQSNEPLFRNRGMKHRRPDWKIWEGQQIHEAGFLKKLIEQLEHIRHEELKQEEAGRNTGNP